MGASAKYADLPSIGEATVPFEYVTLGIYGPAGTGKTSAVVALAEAGHNIIYITTQSNLAPLVAASPEAKSRIKLLRIWDTPAMPNVYHTMVGFYRNNELKVCGVHGLYDCPVCKRSGDPIYKLSVDQMKGHIVVLDCFSDIVNSASHSVKMALLPPATGLDTMKTPAERVDFAQKAEWDFWNGIGSALEPILSYFVRLPLNKVVISHAKDITAGDSNMPPFWAINVGTRNKSGDAMTEFGYLWLTKWHSNPYYGGVQTERSFATSRGREKEFTGRKLNEAIVALFAPYKPSAI